MKLFAIAALVIAIALFLSQAIVRRSLNRATLAGVRNALDEVTRLQVEDVTGTIEGRRQGRIMGVTFVKSTTRGKPDPKSSVEFWCECLVRVPFQARGRPGALFDHEFEFASSQPERLATLQSNAEFAAAMEKLASCGAESIFAVRDRVMATFRPWRRDLLAARISREILDALREVAKAAES